MNSILIQLIIAHVYFEGTAGSSRFFGIMLASLEKRAGLIQAKDEIFTEEAGKGIW